MSRDTTLSTGADGEAAAIACASERGLRLLARNLRTDAGEVDLVLEGPRGLVVFAEVKTRAEGPSRPEAAVAATPAGSTSSGDASPGAIAAEEARLEAFLAVSARKQARYRAAAALVTLQMGRPEAPVRFDVFGVAAEPGSQRLHVEHRPGAFE